MLNFLWGGLILIGILVAAFTGRMPEISNAFVNQSKEAITLCITMLGVVSLWTGLMKIAEDSGLIAALSKSMRPFLNFLFPSIKKQETALNYISTNIIANMLGLSWAATPAGLKAMDELQKINPNKEYASDAMCTFMIFNMSSLQLISVNIIAFRTQYNSANPSEIIGPGLLATLITTLVGVIVAKLFERSG